MTDEPNTQLPESKSQEPQESTEAKFTQADLDAVLTKRLSEQKKSFEKQIEEQKAQAAKQAELAKMSELERLKAEKDDLAAKYQAEADKNALAVQKDETRKLMAEKELPDCFLESVLVPKDYEATKGRIEKIKAVFDEAVKKAVEAKIPAHVPNTGGVEKPDGINKNVAQKPWNKFKQ